jgi:hypothetical protein
MTRKTEVKVDKFQMAFVETDWGGVDWIHLAQQRENWFHKLLRNYRVVTQQVVSRSVLSYTWFVS